MNKIAKITLPAFAIAGALATMPSVFATGPSPLDSVTSPINTTLKESAIIDNYMSGEVDKAVQTAVSGMLTDAGVDMDDYSLNVYCGTASIYYCNISLYTKDYSSSFTKDIKIKYANTDSVTEAERAAIKTKMNLGADFENAPVVYVMHDPGAFYKKVNESSCSGNSCSSGSTDYGEEFWKFQEETVTAKMTERLNDKTIKIVLQAAMMGGMPPEGFETLGFATVYGTKGDVVYEMGKIRVIDGFGLELPDGAPVTFQNLNPEGETYKKLADKMIAKGYKNIIAGYELTLQGEHGGKYPLTFELGAAYEGKTVVVLHQKADGSIEEFEAEVKDSAFSIVVNSLSPFMIALKESGANVGAPDSGAMSIGDNSGASASVLALMAGVVLSLGAVFSVKKAARKEN